jgi:hypothetical protein
VSESDGFTLVGGPFDGQGGPWQNKTPADPPMIWAIPCPNGNPSCDGHVHDAWIQGADRYTRDELEQRGEHLVRRYVHADLDLGPMERARERVGEKEPLEPVAPKERELVPS